MLKLFVQLLVASILWLTLRALAVPLFWRMGVLLLMACVVHWLWDYFFFDLGPVQVASDDPLMAAAREEATRTLPYFLELFPEHKGAAAVKFCFLNSAGIEEFLWGDLLNVDGATATVHVQTLPVAAGSDFERDRELKLDEIVDWQIAFPDGTLRGGFTNRALIDIVNRDQGVLPRALRSELAKYRDFPDGAPQSWRPLVSPTLGPPRVRATNDLAGRGDYELDIPSASVAQVQELLGKMTWENSQILVERQDHTVLDITCADGTFTLTYGDGRNEYWTEGEPITQEQLEACLLGFVANERDCLSAFRWKFLQSQPPEGCLGIVLIAAVVVGAQVLS